MGRKLIDVTGKTHERLTVVGYVQKDGGHWWRCRCVCGTEVLVSNQNWKSRSVDSCGCAWRDAKYRFDLDTERTICAAYEAGTNSPDLAERHACEQSVIRDILRRHGVTLRTTAVSNRTSHPLREDAFDDAENDPEAAL